MTQAVRRKYHYIYKVTRLDESGRYYIGMHSTDNVDDGYFGSGSLLAKSIKKHGKDKHKKEILEFLPTREALKLREKEIVNEELLGDKRCMNLMLGGGGGKTSTSGNARRLEVFKQLLKTPTFKKAYSESLSLSMKQRYANGWINPNLGNKYTDETRKQMSISGAGEKNSQFGTCWVRKDCEAKRIKKEKLGEYKSIGYSLGRIQKIEKHKKVSAHLTEYTRLKPVCRNSECLRSISLLQFKKGIASCSKACSNKTRLLK